jgi:LPS sulfotransferase NodH
MGQVSKQLEPIFIVSAGRSGTTLLRAILNSTDQIYIPYETDFIAKAYRFYGDRQQFSELDYQHLAKFFVLTSQEHGWGLPQEYWFETLKEHSPQSFAEVNSVIYQKYLKLQRAGSCQWGIKHPVLIASMKQIFKTFPKAKLVHIVRDGRDVCLSYKQVHRTAKWKFGPNGILASALYWVDALRRVEEFHTAPVYELRYESLLSNPQQELYSLCKFIGIKYYNEMTKTYQFSERNKNLLSNEDKMIHTQILGGLKEENQNKFLHKMKKSERFFFELLAAPYLRKYMYPIEFKFLNSTLFSPLRFILYSMARLFNNWRYKRRDFWTYRQSTGELSQIYLSDFCCILPVFMI